MFKYLLQRKEKWERKQKAASFVLHQSQQYLRGIESRLAKRLDSRLVRTFYDLFMVILTFRNRSMGLVLSELGGYVCGFDHAAAGTKRISNLLRSKNWASEQVDEMFQERSKMRLDQMLQKGQRPLLLWDDSRLEKPESWFSEGLCPVYSSKGQRLTRIKPGYYRQPRGRICVPGFEWTAVLLSALGAVPRVYQMTWWTSRGKFKDSGDNILYRMLKKIQLQFGSAALHVFDRGYASAQMLQWLFHFQQDFIIRWKKNYLMINELGVEKHTHLVARSYKGQSSRLVWDKERKKFKRLTIAWAPLKHPQMPDIQLYMVIVRDKKNHNGPMYLLTSIPILSAKSAWEICSSYLHRWNVEQAFRFGKSELAMESPRLWFWENRLKLLAIVALVFDFLLQLLQNWRPWVAQFINNWCHRTGNRHRKASMPIYRFRQAISNCLAHCLAQNSG
jgi:hypothetical protein